MKRSVQEMSVLLLICVGLFFMLREWLLPITELTRTAYIELFLVFIALSFVMNFLQWHIVIIWTIKVLYIVWFVTVVYAKVSFFSAEATAFFVRELQVNIAAIASNQLYSMTDAFRTILLLLLIWMMVYLVYYWVTVKLSILYFFLMTISFIAVLDTFTAFDGTTAIVRVMVIGLVLMGLLHIHKLMVGIEVRNMAMYTKLSVPLLSLIAVSSLLAIVLPKASPMWPDPVPFITSLSKQGKESVGKVGYDQDDSRLGGSFTNDDTVVFYATVPERQYWRIESKDTYTSKGWEQSGVDEVLVYGEDVPFATDMAMGSEENRAIATIQQETLYDFLMQPYGTYSATSKSGNDQILFKKYSATGKVQMNVDGKTASLPTYKVVFSTPTYSLTALQQSSLQDFDVEAENLIHYVQLPSTLPARVRNLAVELTQDKQSVYDKVRAIEGYFDNGGFKYDTTDVAVPNDNEDYVDQFLFETKVGYCNNFSSSMVVMLRTIGIPARWVKGFAPGTEGEMVNGLKQFTVTNNDAHSWVEAYIPGVGWMPFEPTIGFSGLDNINNDIPATESSEQPQVDDIQLEEPQQTDGQQLNQTANTWQLFTGWLSSNKQLLLWLLLPFIAICWVLYKKHRKWLPKLYIVWYRRKGFDWTKFDVPYNALLRQLALIGLKRKQGETLSVFAKRVDNEFGTQDMTLLTEAYEVYIYSKSPEIADVDRLKESWEYVMNRTTG